jgi:hypothetical protein
MAIHDDPPVHQAPLGHNDLERGRCTVRLVARIGAALAGCLTMAASLTGTAEGAFTLTILLALCVLTVMFTSLD